MTDAEPSDVAPCEVQVWRVSLSLPETAVTRLQGFLDPGECRRAQRFCFSRDQCRYTISRAALRLILAQHLNRLPEELVFGYGEHGKPHLSNPPAGHSVHFNLSHCQDVTLIAVSPTRRLGIDVEKVRDIAEAQLIAEKYFTADERRFIELAGGGDRLAAFARLWTRREATAKALGLDLGTALSPIGVPVYDSGASSRFEHMQWFLQDLQLDPGHVGAICVEGEPCAVAFRDFEGLPAVS